MFRKIQKSAVFFLSLIMVLLTHCSSNESPTWEVSETSEGLEVKEAGKKVLFYQVAEKSKDGEYTRANYVHPLYGLNEDVLTEDFPEDHFHHRGIFWTWHQVWVGEKRVGDAWLCENIFWDVQNAQTKENKDGTLTITSDVFWNSSLWLDENDEQKSFLKEDVAITVHPESEGVRIVDFEIVLNALADSLYIGGSEDAKGYSGFSVRVFIPDDIQFTSTTGVVEPQTLAVKAGNWMDITGTYMNSDPKSGIIIMNHKDNPGMPQKWILRAKKSMQNPAFPGNMKYEIKKEEPLTLKYRLVLHASELAKDKISTIYEAY